MGFFSTDEIEWWLPLAYILGGLVALLLRWRGKGKATHKPPVDDLDSINAPLLEAHDASEPLLSGNGEKMYSITATSMLWATLAFSYTECVYELVKACLEAADNGFGTVNFRASLALCVAWLLAALARSHDHWFQASLGPPAVDAAGKPRRQRMWWALWPFFNLSFITAATDYFPGMEGGRGFMEVVQDDELWSVIVRGLALLTVTHAGLLGAPVRLVRTPPNEEYRAGFFSAAFFNWFSPTIERGYTKQLDTADLPVLMDDDRSADVWDRLTRCPARSPLDSCFGRGGRRRGSRGAAPAAAAAAASKEMGGGENGGGEVSDLRAAELFEVDDCGPLLWRLYRLVRPIFWVQGAWQLVASVSEFGSPLAMQQIVDFVENYAKEGGKGGVDATTAFFVILLFAGPAVQAIADGRNFHMGRRIGCRVRGALVGSVFRKMLRMDTSSAQHSAGELTNLMSVDAQGVLEFSPYVHFLYTTVLQVVISIAFLFYVLGLSAFGGLAFMLISMPLGKYTTKRTQAYQKTLMKCKDERMSVVGEVMQGVRIIKLFAWEKDFLGRIHDARAAEMRSLRSYMVMMAGVIVQWNSVTTLVGLCTFIVHTQLLGKTLTASQGFTALSLFNILRFPLLVLPDVINFYLQSAVSLGRVEKFLNRSDVDGQGAVAPLPPPPPGAAAAPAAPAPAADGATPRAGAGAAAAALPRGTVRVTDGTFAWATEKPLSSREGGAEGSGDGGGGGGGDGEGEGSLQMDVQVDGGTEETKHLLPEEGGDEEKDDNGTTTALPSSSAGDSGSGSANQDTAASWPPPPTLRGIAMEARPGQLVCVYGPTGCGKSSLLLAMLGEIRRLSGGVEVVGSVAYAAQRAWIQNATLKDNVLFGLPLDEGRYQQALSACALLADVELLEAGDMTEIGEKGINLSGGQQQRVSLGRAVYADADVYLLDDVLSAVDAHVGEHIFKNCVRGMLVNQGKTVVMVTHQVPMTAQYADQVVLMAEDGTITEMGDPQALMRDKGSRLHSLLNKVGGGERVTRQHSISSNLGVEDEEQATAAPGAGPAGGKGDASGGGGGAGGGAGTLVKDEGRLHGAPGLKVYVEYAKASGGVLGFLLPYLVLHVSYNLLQFFQNLLLSDWVDHLEEGEGETRAMWAYIGISAAVIVAVFARSLFQSLSSLRASVSLHDGMASRVMRAPIGWFETTPLGRILNRFASDMQEIDKNLMEAFGSTLACAFSAGSIVVVISYTVPYLIVALVPISGLALVVAGRYLTTSRELKRLDSVSRSPIYAHFSESVAGVSTIRAFGAQTRFIQESCRRVDTCNRAHFYLWVSNRWFNVRIQLLGASVALLAGVFVAWWGKDHLRGTVAGLALLYALQFTDALKYLVRQHALLEMQMNAVERVSEYTNLPQEAAAQVPGRRPPPGWPARGEVDVKGLSLKYPSASSPVFEDLTFRIEPQTRVGVVGRTGAGKSSLCVALFRMVEPLRGSMTIDGEDALAMGLEDLRSRIAIVPQDPVLFRGTVRSNLDPFAQYADTELWEALRRARMDQQVSQSGGLDSDVGEGGANLSVGQRQLLCMARALLRRSGILCMDEATANVDPEMDILIQATMQEEFRDCTVLCIAHRLHTIIYYDKIMVLEQGHLAEYATPLELLEDTDSLFYSLCEKTGALEQLKATARGEQEALAQLREEAALAAAEANQDA